MRERMHLTELLEQIIEAKPLAEEGHTDYVVPVEWGAYVRHYVEEERDRYKPMDDTKPVTFNMKPGVMGVRIYRR